MATVNDLDTSKLSGRGRLIVFEGPDRSGKTTQTMRCVRRLVESGFKVAEGCPWRFPDRETDVGKLIDAYLKQSKQLDDRTLHLLFSANRWEKVSMICDALSAGETVVIDRYAYSGVAYSSAKGLDLDWCKSPDHGLPAPDLVIYLDISSEAAAQRGNYGSERYEREEMQRKVADQYRLLRNDSWFVIDADAPLELVSERVNTAIDTLMSSNPGPLTTLWGT